MQSIREELTRRLGQPGLRRYRLRRRWTHRAALFVRLGEPAIRVRGARCSCTSEPRAPDRPVRADSNARRSSTCMTDGIPDLQRARSRRRRPTPRSLTSSPSPTSTGAALTPREANAVPTWMPQEPSATRLLQRARRRERPSRTEASARSCTSRTNAGVNGLAGASGVMAPRAARCGHRRSRPSTTKPSTLPALRPGSSPSSTRQRRRTRPRARPPGQLTLR